MKKGLPKVSGPGVLCNVPEIYIGGQGRLFCERPEDLISFRGRGQCNEELMV